MYVICDTKSGIIMDFSTEIEREDGSNMFHDITNGIWYPDDISVYYEFEDVPKYVRIGDWKYTESDGFKRAFDPEETRELRMNQMKRFKAMTEAMKQYDGVVSIMEMLICSALGRD